MIQNKYFSNWTKTLQTLVRVISLSGSEKISNLLWYNDYLFSVPDRESETRWNQAKDNQTRINRWAEMPIQNVLIAGH
jgi:hypothetical protein